MTKLEEVEFGAWKPIAELSEALFEEYEWQTRLMVANDCNGPHLVTTGDCYMNAEEVKDNPWECFLILPEQPVLADTEEGR